MKTLYLIKFKKLIAISALWSFCYRFQYILQILRVDFTFYGNKIDMYSFPYLHVITENNIRTPQKGDGQSEYDYPNREREYDDPN